MKIFGCLVIICMAAISLCAETITLRNGEVIEGRIVEETNEYIRMMNPAGYIEKYPLDDIEVAGDAAVEPVDSSLQAAKKDPVKAQIRDNLKKTETMIQDTLKQLYPEPPAKRRTSGQEPDRKMNQLQEERNRRYGEYEQEQ